MRVESGVQLKCKGWCGFRSDISRDDNSACPDFEHSTLYRRSFIVGKPCHPFRMWEREIPGETAAGLQTNKQA